MFVLPFCSFLLVLGCISYSCIHLFLFPPLPSISVTIGDLIVNVAISVTIGDLIVNVAISVTIGDLIVNVRIPFVEFIGIVDVFVWNVMVCCEVWMIYVCWFL